ncbi:MAG: CBS domain-containing protein [Chloroflexi bacterium]|nr:CBS domain-containing protein [Chloroflexota bacterium]
MLFKPLTLAEIEKIVDLLLNDLRARLGERRIGLVVTEPDGYLAGIITRNDVLRGYLDSDDWQRLAAGKYMTRDVITVAPEDLLGTVANLLLDHHIHRVVVVRQEDGKQKPMAVVSATDLIYHMMKEIE